MVATVTSDNDQLTETTFDECIYNFEEQFYNTTSSDIVTGQSDFRLESTSMTDFAYGE